MAKIKLPTLLNYTRSMVPSEGIFRAVNHKDFEPLSVSDKTVLGTISNYSGVYKKEKQQDESKINKEMMAGGNNIQRIDACHLPPDFDCFRLEFTLKFLPNSLGPEACNDLAFREGLEDFSAAYKDKGGYRHLASMYFANLVNGRFLWRNRYGIDRTLTLTAPFDGFPDEEFAIINTNSPIIPDELKEKAEPWITAIAEAFSDKRPPFVLKACAQVNIGSGQEVYPSQEFVEGKRKKTLFTVQMNGSRVAAMHSQKIGNALRTIDIWYPGATDARPLAVDPFTVDKRLGKTVRLPELGKSDFYSYLKDVKALTERVCKATDVTEIPSEAHYFTAVLIRGGVFSGESDKK